MITAWLELAEDRKRNNKAVRGSGGLALYTRVSKGREPLPHMETSGK